MSGTDPHFISPGATAPDVYYKYRAGREELDSLLSATARDIDEEYLNLPEELNAPQAAMSPDADEEYLAFIEELNTLQAAAAERQLCLDAAVWDQKELLLTLAAARAAATEAALRSSQVQTDLLTLRGWLQRTEGRVARLAAAAARAKHQTRVLQRQRERVAAGRALRVVVPRPPASALRADVTAVQSLLGRCGRLIHSIPGVVAELSAAGPSEAQLMRSLPAAQASLLASFLHPCSDST